MADVPPVRQNCVMLKGIKDEVFLLSVQDSFVIKSTMEGYTVSKELLPTPFDKCKIQDACLSAVGIFAILEDSSSKHFLLLDEKTLKVKKHYLHRPDALNLEVMYSLVSDKDGRVFLRKDDGIFLLTETGDIPSSWYYFRRVPILTIKHRFGTLQPGE
jgi:hypothetical protein